MFTRIWTNSFSILATASDAMDAFSAQRDDVKRNYSKRLREAPEAKRTLGEQVCAETHGLV